MGVETPRDVQRTFALAIMCGEKKILAVRDAVPWPEQGKEGKEAAGKCCFEADLCGFIDLPGQPAYLMLVMIVKSQGLLVSVRQIPPSSGDQNIPSAGGH